MYKNSDKYNQCVTFTSNKINVNSHSHIKHSNLLCNLINIALQGLAIAIILFCLYVWLF